MRYQRIPVLLIRRAICFFPKDLVAAGSEVSCRKRNALGECAAVLQRGSAPPLHLLLWLSLSVELLASSRPGFEEEAKKTPQLKYQQCFLYSCTSKIVFSAVAVNGSLYVLYVLPASMCLSLQAHSVFEAELWKSIVCVELCQEKGTESEKTNHTNRIVKSDREKCNEY